MTEISPNIEWTEVLEKYFADMGEKAHALSWLHKKAQERYAGMKSWIELPVIVLGVLNGSVSIGSNTLFGDTPFASVGVGLIALFTAILGAIGSYYKWSARCEAHRIAALQYAKLYRFLQVQCSLPRDERMMPSDLLKTTKDAYDQLAEVAPLVPPAIVEAFRKKFDKPEYKHISRPEECNGLEHIEVYSPKPVEPPETAVGFTGAALSPPVAPPPPPRSTRPSLSVVEEAPPRLD